MRHTSTAVVLVLMGTLAAGCTAPSPAGDGFGLTDDCGRRSTFGGDRSKEVIEYVFEAQGPWRVTVPVVLSEDGAAMDDWEGHFQAEGTWTRVAPERGPGFEVAGEGGLSSRAVTCTIQRAGGGSGCCAEQYLDGAWSMGPDDTRPESIWIHVGDGPVSVTVSYEAESDLCGRDADFRDAGLASGWHRIPGEDAAECA